MKNEAERESPAKLLPQIERRELGETLLWERWRFRTESATDGGKWVDGKKEIQGAAGMIAVGHFTGQALTEELDRFKNLHRFVWVVTGGELLFLPAGVEFSGEFGLEGAWVIELSSTNDEREADRPIPIDLEEIKPKGSAQWIGPWVNENLPPTIHIALEGGSTEAPYYQEVHHYHEATTEFYVIGKGRTITSFIEEKDLPPGEADQKRPSQRRTSGGLRRDISAALWPGDLLIIYPSNKAYHAEPVPRYSAQRSLAIKWEGGKIVDSGDKVTHRVEKR